MDNVLTKIVADKKQHVATCKARTPLAELQARAQNAGPTRDFYGALEVRHAAKETALICEIKKASPSAGLIRPDFDPATIAKSYEAAGASCLSILTDTPYFQGLDEHLVQARAAVKLPVLRKDFMIDPYQIVEARALGADCVLLIVACLSKDQLEDMLGLAAENDLSILVEIHDEEELERYFDLNVDVPKTLLGINNRNLKTLAIDLGTTERLARIINDDRLLVGESGIRNRDDIQRLKNAGVHCFLIGENLLKQQDIGTATKALF